MKGRPVGSPHRHQVKPPLPAPTEKPQNAPNASPHNKPPHTPQTTPTTPPNPTHNANIPPTPQTTSETHAPPCANSHTPPPHTNSSQCHNTAPINPAYTPHNTRHTPQLRHAFTRKQPFHNRNNIPTCSAKLPAGKSSVSDGVARSWQRAGCRVGPSRSGTCWGAFWMCVARGVMCFIAR